MENEEYTIGPDGKEITCAVVIQNELGEILGCHSTGKRWGPTTFDLPKGHQNTSDASPLDAAIRECKEETGLDLSDKKDDFVDLGEYSYTDEKNIHLFYISMEIPPIKTLHCDSTFTGPYGKQIPEVNGFALIKHNELNMFFKIIQDVLKRAGI